MIDTTAKPLTLTDADIGRIVYCAVDCVYEMKPDDPMPDTAAVVVKNEKNGSLGLVFLRDERTSDASNVFGCTAWIGRSVFASQRQAFMASLDREMAVAVSELAKFRTLHERFEIHDSDRQG